MSTTIPRPAYVERIMAFADTPFVKILTGVRRCGKSAILGMVEAELRQRGVPDGSIAVYRLESMEGGGFKTPKQFYDDVRSRLAPSGRTYLLLDEVQEIPTWEKAVSWVVTDFDVDVFIASSNLPLATSEEPSLLTGRYVQFRIHPLSFAEYLTFREVSGARGGTYAEFDRYLRLGGFPAVHLREHSADEAYAIVRGIYESTVLTDIVPSGRIRRVERFERLVRYMLENVGRTLSAHAIARYVRAKKGEIDNEAVTSHLSKLECAFVLLRCSTLDLQTRGVLRTQGKFYACDPAVRHSVLGYSQYAEAAMLENVVYLELLRRGYDVHIGKLADGAVDFVADRRDERIYVQMSPGADDGDACECGCGPILGIEDGCPKYVLRTDGCAGRNCGGVTTMHVADFLLCDEY